MPTPPIFRFITGDADSALAWIENLCGVPEFPLRPQWDTLELTGKGTFGVVYRCTLETGEACAVKVILEEDNWVRKTRPRESEVVQFLKTKKLLKKHAGKSWTQEAYETLSEIENARFMGREGVGPHVYGAAVLLHGNPVARIGACIFMELLETVEHPQSVDVVGLLRKMANRRMCALDLKSEHIMRSARGVRLIDYGGSWCVRRVNALQEWRSQYSDTGGIAALERRVMFAVMVTQLALFDLFWVGKKLLLMEVLWHIVRNPDVWKLVRLVFASSQMEPICNAYYHKQEGGDLIDALCYSLKHATLAPDNVLVSEYTGRPYTREELYTNITERQLHRPCF